MIFADQKPFDEIYASIKGFKKVLLLGCGTCTTVSMSGGAEEVNVLASKIKLKDPDIELVTATIRRQCDNEFIEEIKEATKDCEAILSLACGAGVQMISDMFEDIPVIPGLNTRFIGTNEGEESWKERCSMCGECILDKTGGICPHTICPKGIMNGPCGGCSEEGMCEVNSENECAWVQIYRRLENQNRVENISEVFQPNDFSRTRSPQFNTKAKMDLKRSGGKTE